MRPPGAPVRLRRTDRRTAGGYLAAKFDTLSNFLLLRRDRPAGHRSTTRQVDVINQGLFVRRAPVRQ